MDSREDDSDENLERTTLGNLAEWAPPPEETDQFKLFIDVLDKYYPKDWRSWEINEVSYQDLFGEKISSDDECRLRFAVPTVELGYIFAGPSGVSLSVRKYNSIKKTLLTWPLGRATIYCPIATMKMIHPIDAFNGFTIFLTDLKPHLISRAEAEKSLKRQDERDDSSVASQKREHSPEPGTSKKLKVEERDDILLNFMKQQSDILQKLYQLQANKSMPEKTGTEKSDNIWVALSFDETELGHNDLTEEHPETVSNSSSEDSEEEGVLLDFAPETKESEAKISSAREDLVKQGAQCQRLGQEGWQNIRYADVQKNFQATPVFTNLKVNSNLATVTPPWQIVTVLEKMDLCLGAITHGLLQQRKEFQEIYQKSSLEMKKEISKNFLSPQSSFRKTSDTLLQYTCGKRAEVIQQRRSLYKPPNKVLNELLHSIPPSSSHLFSEPQLADLIKEQGGVSKFFPIKSKFKPKTVAKNKSSTFRKENRSKSRQHDYYKKGSNFKGSSSSSARTGNNQQRSNQYGGKNQKSEAK